MKYVTKGVIAFDGINRVMAVLAGLLLAFATLTVCAEIVVRYFGGEIIWAIEAAEYCLVWITFCGTTWVLANEKHVMMDSVLTRLNPRAQCIVNIVTSSIGTIIVLIITWYGILAVLYYYQTGSVMITVVRPLRWPLMTIMPVGTFLLSVQFARRTYRYWMDWKNTDNAVVRGEGTNT
ncbi:TRAP transporter small permease [Chloroflexota bacterium]